MDAQRRAFEPGTDLDIATVEVNNRVKRVEPLLPQVVLQNGVKVDKTNPAMLLIVTMQSKTGQFDRDYLSNLANSNVVPELKRIGGVGDVTLFGYPYAMRDLAQPGPPRQVPADGDRRRERDPRAEPELRGRRDRHDARARGAGADVPGPDRRARSPSRSSSPTSSSAPPPTGRWSACATSARVELGAEDYQVSDAPQRPARRAASASTCARAPTRWRRPRRSRAKMAELATTFPRDVEWRVPVRHHGVRRRLDRARPPHLRRGVRPRADRRVPVPRQPPRHDHPDARDPGVARSARWPACC